MIKQTTINKSDIIQTKASQSITTITPRNPLQFPQLLREIHCNFRSCPTQSNPISVVDSLSSIQFPQLPQRGPIHTALPSSSTQFPPLPRATKSTFRSQLSQADRTSMLYTSLPVIHVSKYMVLHHCQLPSPHLHEGGGFRQRVIRLSRPSDDSSFQGL